MIFQTNDGKLFVSGRICRLFSHHVNIFISTVVYVPNVMNKGIILSVCVEGSKALQ